MARTTRLRIFALGFVLLILVAVSPAYAATIDSLTVTCDRVTIRGRTEISTFLVRVQVVLASDLTDILAKKVVPVWFVSGSEYRATLDFSDRNLPDGTLLVIAAGEWNGFRYLRPATIVSAYCGGGSGSTPTPTPFDLSPTPTPFDPTPTPPTFPPPTYTPTPFDLTPTPPTFPPPTYTPTPFVPPPTSTPINVTPAPTRTPPPPPTLTRTPLPPPTLTRTPFPPPTPSRTPFVPTPTQIIVTPSPPYTPTPLPTFTPPS